MRAFVLAFLLVLVFASHGFGEENPFPVMFNAMGEQGLAVASGNEAQGSTAYRLGSSAGQMVMWALLALVIVTIVGKVVRGILRLLFVLLVVGLGVAGYFQRDHLQAFVASKMPAPAPTVRELEVRKTFDHWASLFSQGDPKSESVYAPNVVFRLSYLDARGQRVEKQSNAAQHLARSQKVLPHLKSGRFKVRFDDIQIREQPDGTVHVDYLAYLNDGDAEKTHMTFTNTAPQRWAVLEEVHTLPGKLE